MVRIAWGRDSTFGRLIFRGDSDTVRVAGNGAIEDDSANSVQNEVDHDRRIANQF